MNIKAGDIVERPGPMGAKHRAVFAGFDSLARPWVIHNAKNDCVRVDTLETFAAGLPVTLASRVARNLSEQALIVRRAQSLLARRYDLLKFNCDHFVTYAQNGVASSPQVAAVAAVAGLALLVGLATVAGRA